MVALDASLEAVVATTAAACCRHADACLPETMRHSARLQTSKKKMLADTCAPGLDGHWQAATKHPAEVGLTVAREQGLLARHPGAEQGYLAEK